MDAVETEKSLFLPGTEFRNRLARNLVTMLAAEQFWLSHVIQ
jgi:hypothetical protein